MYRFIPLFILGVILFLQIYPQLTAFHQNNQPQISAAPTGVTLGKQTKTVGCIVHEVLPDSDCTPGATIQGVTKEQVCTAGYAKSVRNVSLEEKNQVYLAYGITSRQEGEYEVDHLISLELGGSNDSTNLWPQAADPRPGFHEKDQVENYLHEQVCTGGLSLETAQQEIATNWLFVYEQLPKR